MLPWFLWVHVFVYKSCNFIICHLFVAFSNSGELVVPKEFSLNKIGHGRYVINLLLFRHVSCHTACSSVTEITQQCSATILLPVYNLVSKKLRFYTHADIHKVNSCATYKLSLNLYNLCNEWSKSISRYKELAYMYWGKIAYLRYQTLYVCTCCWLKLNVYERSHKLSWPFI